MKKENDRFTPEGPTLEHQELQKELEEMTGSMSQTQ